ncbi:UDP-N-acetylglucosamine 2-epimerase [Candidatus Pristimantibacillus sp. PTI5]|uniref:UDP-N-acetylglucosamine 2-epimerase n=1 Tax=Candidatus Pristimantibacillus sp. PTI5 TaxID=3400422 RepID=UPI003B021D31
MKKRKIVGITGIRSEYDIMSSVFKAITNHPFLELELIVTGAHLSDSYGNTVNEISQDNFKIADRIESLLNSDQSSSRVKGLGIQLQGMIQTITRVNPDFLLVLGDREEAMSTALVGAYMNIPVAHIAGGDRVIGNVDDQIRHAVTKLAHLHFTTNEESAERIIKLGEESFRIFNVGNPGLDRIKSVPFLTKKELSEKMGFHIEETEPVVVLIQHVISTEIEEAYNQMKITMESVKEMGIKTIISYPNSDAGGQQMIKAINEYRNEPFIHVSKNIPRLEFINLLRHASCLLGNSSAGILEAPYLKLPVVNVGNRQKGRLHGENVQFVRHDPNEICQAVTKAIFDQEYIQKVKASFNPYGNGDSSDKIADVLATIAIDDKLLIKEITY